jgi:hypothetical protein
MWQVNGAWRLKWLAAVIDAEHEIAEVGQKVVEK